jgi:DNA-binding FadR family transcriptional regulator
MRQRKGTSPQATVRMVADSAAKLYMSRTPVHEAIIRLQSEGLVKVDALPQTAAHPDKVRAGASAHH